MYLCQSVVILLFLCIAWDKKATPPPRFIYCSVYICWQVLTIFGTQYIEKIFTTKVIDLPTLLTQCCALPHEKLISSFQLIAFWFFFSSMWVALKRVCLLMMRWGCRLGDGQSYCRCSEWPPLTATQAVQCSHATSLHSHLSGHWNLSCNKHSVKLENNIWEKALFIWSAY